jgi:hypothetical protein
VYLLGEVNSSPEDSTPLQVDALFVDPRGCYSNSCQNLIAQVRSLVSDVEGQGCAQVVGSPTCAQGFDFTAHSGAQIRLFGDWTALGHIVRAKVRHYPTNTVASASFVFQCSSADSGKTFTMRTRGKAGIKHNGVWFFTAFQFSDPRTETCP